MEKMVMLLICVPFAMALLMAVIRNSKARAAAMYICATAVAAMAIAVAVMWIMAGMQPMEFDLPGSAVFDKIILVGDFALMAFVMFKSFRNKKGWIAILSFVQTMAVGLLEIFGESFGFEVSHSASLRIDWLTFIMIIIIGIVGVAIGIYAVGYMHGYHHHHFKEVKDRRSFFFAMIFVFYGAMFGLVTSQSLIWLYFFWEITSICSFMLIGYTRTEEAVENSFKALWMNLLGGAGIATAIGYAVITQGTTNLYVVINNAAAGAGEYVLIPIAMLAIAALTKSAQFPFSGWLLGAMVAPTPSSALLHSATMVKAGVYLLVRISIAMRGNSVGQMVYLVGGFTFLAASCLAISQSDGKKVLAYSTISNLGLIVACAGAGYPETIWAAVFLIIYHAVSKSMLFQCVGAIENTTGSRDIESMEGLAMRYPKLGAILMIGIAAMFLAPFGMLVSKWAAFKAFVEINLATGFIMVLFIAFGSATTMFYWTKWMSKILGVHKEQADRDLTKKSEYISMFFHAALIVALAVSFPFLSKGPVGSLISTMFGTSTQVMNDDNLIIMMIMVVGIFIVPFINFLISKCYKKREVLAYMGGANAGDNKNFVNSAGEPTELHVSNWYMQEVFAEEKILWPSIWIGLGIIAIFLGIVIGGALR